MTSKAWKCPPAFPPSWAIFFPFLKQQTGTYLRAFLLLLLPTPSLHKVPGLLLPPSFRSQFDWEVPRQPSVIHPFYKPIPTHSPSLSTTYETNCRAPCISLPRENKLHQNGICLHCCWIFTACNAAYHVIPSQLIPVKRMNLTIWFPQAIFEASYGNGESGWKCWKGEHERWEAGR